MKKRKKKKKWLVLLLAVLLFVCQNGGRAEVAEAKSYCKIGSALKYTAKQLSLGTGAKRYEEYQAALCQAGILLEGELTSMGKAITRAEVSLLASRIMDYRGEPEDTAQVDRILRYRRISDLEQAEPELRRPIARVFGAGILIGTSDGNYTQSRAIEPKKKLTEAEVRSVIKKALGTQSRKAMSPDGQLIRTSKLPFNASEYEYILASFPNRFYTVKFGYERAEYNHMPVSPKQYASPVNLKNRSNYAMIAEWKYEWADLLRKNYELRLNFDYRTAKEDWAEELAATYHSRYDPEEHAAQKERIQDWVKWAKQNKVILESRIVSVEPSVFYYDGHLSTSAYLEFRVRSCRNFEKNKDKIVFGSSCDIPEVKLKQWYGGVFGCEISWYSMTPSGDSAGVPIRDGLWTGWEKDRKKSLMEPVKKSEWNYGFAPVKEQDKDKKR